MRKLIHIFQLLNGPCRDMSALASKAMDEKLPFWERVAYKSHLIYCRACRRYIKQLRLLREALRQASDKLADSPRDSLSEDARTRIARALRDQPE